MDIGSVSHSKGISSPESVETNRKPATFAGLKIGQGADDNGKLMETGSVVKQHDISGAQTTGETSEVQKSTSAQGAFGKFKIGQGAGNNTLANIKSNVSGGSLGSRIADNGAS